MPNYEYQCPICKAVFVEKRAIADRDLNPPTCCYEQETTRVILTPPAGSVDTPAAG